MASLYRRAKSKYWWVKYKLNGIENYASTKCVKKFDAERVLNTKYVPLEVNAYNKKCIFPVHKSLKEALVEFRDTVLIHSHDGIRQKSSGTIDRQQTNLNNFLKYVEKKDYTEFGEISEEGFRDYIQNHLIKEKKKKANSIYKDVQIAVNFFQWAV